jgi:uncharacterized metal-binding protein YceD (DUF177 family)
MEINIHHIQETGLNIDSSIPAEALEIEDKSRILKMTPVICELKASMSNKDLFVRGDLTVVLDCKCDRCLKETEIQVHAEDICIVIKNTPDIVDLTNYIREDIILAFPQLYLCDENCKGLCFNCGKNLNKEECECDLSQEETSPWDALNSINFKDKDKDSSGE